MTAKLLEIGVALFCRKGSAQERESDCAEGAARAASLELASAGFLVAGSEAPLVVARRVKISEHSWFSG